MFEDQSEHDWFNTIIQGSSGTGIRAKRILEWNAEWEEFCEWIVREYGNEAQRELSLL